MTGCLVGTVIRTGTGLLLVRVSHGPFEGLWVCRARGRLRAQMERESDSIYVGDRVTLGGMEPEDAAFAGMATRGRGVIESVLPRKTKFGRLSTGPVPVGQTLATNVDLAVVVFAAVAPPLRIGGIDRYTTLASQAGIDCCVCVNKMDQLSGYVDQERAGGNKERADGDQVSADGDQKKVEGDREREKVDRAVSLLRGRGVTVFTVSALTGEGIAELRLYLEGKTSVFVGPSGAGKTSILKALCPGFDSKTLSISTSTGKGRHSTTYSSLWDIGGGGYVADLPGMRAIGFWQLSQETVKSEFADIEDLAAGCRYRDCTHQKEPGCAVRAALQSGALPRERFTSYMKVRKEAGASRTRGQRKVARPQTSRSGRRAEVMSRAWEESEEPVE